MRQNIIVFLLTLSLLGCTGGGSEIGPIPPVQPNQQFSGQLIAANGSPIVGVAVNLEGQSVNGSGVSDRWGRFRIPEAANGSHTLIADGRTGASRGVGEAFPKFRIPATVSGSTAFSKPIVLPNLASASGQAGQKTVAIGTTLSSSDDLTIAGAGLTLTLNGARVDWTNPADHVGETQVTISAAILPSQDSPFPLEEISGPLAPALVLWIDPPDITFTTQASLSYTSTFFPNAASNVQAYRYAEASALWLSTGTASVAGGVISTVAVVYPGFFALAADCSSSTTVTGRVIDESGAALSGALISAPGGRSAVSASDGTFSIADVCASDGNGAAISGTFRLCASSTQLFTTATQTVNLVPGGTTALGDWKLFTKPAGEIHFLLVREGLVVPDREVAVGSHDAGFGARSRTGNDGVVSFFDVPADSNETFQALTAQADPSVSPISVDAGGKFFAPASYFSDGLFTGDSGNFEGNSLGSTLQVIVLREDSDAPIENAFVMIGTDPATDQQGFTNASGQIVFSVSGTPTVTAGVQNTAPAGGGSGFDLVRKTAYRSVKAVNGDTVVIRLPVARRLEALSAPWDPFGRVAGTASDLTNPTVTPSSNGSGTYAVDIHATPAGRALTLFPAMEERSDFDLLTPAGSDASIGYTSGGVLDSSYVVDAPLFDAYLVGVERDAASATAGSIVRFGLAGPFSPSAGSTVTQNISLDRATSGGAISLTVPGMETALASSRVANLGIEFPDGTGALLGDATAQVSGFSASSGTATLLLPGLTGALEGGAYRLRFYAQLDSAGILRRQDVFLRTTGTAITGDFRAVPEFSVPTPLGSFDPTVAGISWTSSSECQLHRVRLTQSATVAESGVTIRDDFDWQVYTPSEDRSFIFPVLPSTLGNKTVPAFFKAAQPYSIEIRALEMQVFDYKAFLSNTSRVRIAELTPEAESVYRASATTP